MDAVNPYQPPTIRDQVDENSAGADLGMVAARIHYSPEFLVESVARISSQRRFHRMLKKLLWPVVILLSVIGVEMLLDQEFVAAVYSCGAAVFILFSRQLAMRQLKGLLRRSPHCNLETKFEFCDAGVLSQSRLAKTQQEWSAFSKAVLFCDGVLIYQGETIAHWIPDVALEGEGSEAAIRAMLRKWLPTSDSIGESRRKKSGG